MVEHHGEPVAALVPIALYEHWERERDAFFDRMEQAAARANLSQEEADELVAEAIAAMRRDRR